MARTTKAERKRRREAALVKISEGYGFADTVTFVMSEWGCSRSTARRDCHWAHDELQLGLEAHDVQHLVTHLCTSLQRISLKAESDKQFASSVGAAGLRNRPPVLSVGARYCAGLSPLRDSSLMPTVSVMPSWRKYGLRSV